ncbi:acyl carrier protein [Paenibacillus sp. UMB7766-LJ446]|uniref:acyl carrier protein n=1 Tax=Paenibacillus sp. UMB7766-LJ446 TaxID=3046313 RepID=UPI00254CE879|nr:acyl carrier protein [Paenibacillus sp. UMB7766-LJ446]MDK8191933.1 acyl carrier protein [Paenibacillus sp. UMB7766-LJ446]
MKNIEQRFLNVIQKEFPEADIEFSMDTNLIEAGVNSISFIKLVILIENEFDIQFEETKLDLNYFPTIREILEYIEQQSKSEDTN